MLFKSPTITSIWPKLSYKESGIIASEYVSSGQDCHCDISNDVTFLWVSHWWRQMRHMCLYRRAVSQSKTYIDIEHGIISDAKYITTLKNTRFEYSMDPELNMSPTVDIPLYISPCLVALHDDMRSSVAYLQKCLVSFLVWRHCLLGYCDKSKSTIEKSYKPF